MSSALTTGLPERRYRPELHGLRGLAIVLVVAFHLFGQGRVSGGIDVFLCVSGYLFTGILLRESARRGGPVSVSAYFGRLARRLLPPMIVVVAAVTLAGLIVLPGMRHEALLREAGASLLYVENWALISSQLQYEAAGPATSPFQHIWSLSVQGQFYLLWPVLTVAAVLVAKRMGWSARRAMIGVSVAVVIGSFSYAVFLHETDQAVAYLHTGSRLWQLAIGALLALIGTRVVPRRARPVTGWIGIALIVSCGFILDGAELFPGPWALWPVLGFVLVMTAEHPAPWGVSQVLARAPFSAIGDISYALYLWHWPLLIFWLTLRGRDELGWRGASVILIGALILSYLTHRFIERPATAWFTPRPRVAIAAGAVLVALVAGGALAGLRVVEAAHADRLAEAVAADPDRYPGALALDPRSPRPVPKGVEPIPSFDVAHQDQPDYYAWPCRQTPSGSGEVTVCDDPEHPEGSPGWRDRPVVLVTGGSHAGQWVPTFRVLAQRHGWRVLVADMAGCQLTTNRGQYPPPRDVPVSEACQEWNEGIVEVIDDLAPDAVFTLATTSLGKPESTPLGFLDQWEHLREREIPVVGIRDSPRRVQPVPECLVAADDPDDCTVNRRSGAYGLADPSPFTQLSPRPDIGYVDLSQWYCPGTKCPAVIGNVLVYRDASHLSSAYARSLADPLDAELRRVAPQLYRSQD